jgi:flagellar motility protein MotE (MotC chaperone)
LKSILSDRNILNFILLPTHATNKLVVFTKEIIIDKFVQERILPAVEDLSSSYIFEFVPKGSKKILISLEAIQNFCESISDLSEAKEQDQASTQEEEKRREEAKISKEDMKRIGALIKESKENVEALIDLVKDLFPKESKEPIQVSPEELDKLRDKRVKEFLSNQESKLF